jgi:hypothetical protein
MKQKDLITYGLIGLAVYFLFLKKEDKESNGGPNTGGPESSKDKGPDSTNPDVVLNSGSKDPIYKEGSGPFDPARF